MAFSGPWRSWRGRASIRHDAAAAPPGFRDTLLRFVQTMRLNSIAAFMEAAFEQDYLQRQSTEATPTGSRLQLSAMVDQLRVRTGLGSFSSERDCFSAPTLATPE